MKVSVVTVVYNAVDTIERTIKSVINQTYNDIEYIVVDACSNDGTSDVIDRYSDKIDILIREPDDGIYYAMNKAIDFASGELIGFINADDWYELNAIEVIVNTYMHDKDLSVIYGDTNIINKDGTSNIRKRIPLSDICFNMPFCHQSVFARTSLYRVVGGYDTKFRIASDRDVFLKALERGYKFKFIETVIANYSACGITGSNQEWGAKESCEVVLGHLDFFHLKKNTVIEHYKKRAFVGRLRGDLDSNPIEVVKSILGLKEIQEKKIVVWGAGQWGKRIINAFRLADVEIRGIIDKNLSKKQESLYDIPFIEINSLNTGDTVIIAFDGEHGEIDDQLERLNISGLSLLDLARSYIEMDWTFDNVE